MKSRTLVWVGIAILAGCTALAIFIGIRAFDNPVGFGKSVRDGWWAVFFGVLLAGMGILLWFWRGKALLGFSLAAGAACVLLTATLSGALSDVLVVLWLLAAGLLLGERLLTW